VTSKNETTLRIRHAPAARVLAFVLLLLVAYSTTAEAVHKHGNLLVRNQATQGISVASTPDGTGSSLNDSRSLGDCLICQLHQNLSTTLFSPLPQAIAPVVQATLAPTVEVSYLSHAATPQRGRAPPFASLS